MRTRGDIPARLSPRLLTINPNFCIFYSDPSILNAVVFDIPGFFVLFRERDYAILARVEGTMKEAGKSMHIANMQKIMFNHGAHFLSAIYMCLLKK